MNVELEKIYAAAQAIRERHREAPVVGLILGSGLGAYADTLTEKTAIPYGGLPHFPSSTVLGHSGNLILGRVEGVPAAALQGRAHFYEGYDMSEVTFATRVLGALGVRCLVVTNASGGINTSYRPGDLMLISDHLNLTGTNPLVGPNADALGERFPDMSEAYSGRLRNLARQVAGELDIPLREGVYAGLTGPSYETPAEIRMLRTLGADAVGMSTVPEVIVANHMKMNVLGISCITNMAAGILPQKLTHQEVMDTGARVKDRFASLLSGVIARIPALL